MARNASSIQLLNPDTWPWALYPPVTTADTFEGQTTNLNENGLYSPTIFGRQGLQQREETPSWIDIKLPVFNPVWFNAMISLKGLYSGIIKGKEYALWDATQKDFIKSNVIEGETGFSYFVSHLGELEPKETDSIRRKKKLSLFHTQRDIALTRKVLVIPAGLRDIEFRPDGSVTENEINDLYRKLIFRSRSLTRSVVDTEDPLYDNIRWGLQDAFNAIDNYLFTLLKGKGGFFQRNVIRRSVFGATRNVISARHDVINDCDDDAIADLNSILIGMFQSLLAYAPLNVYSLSNGVLSRVFASGTDMARLVNPKTFEDRYVEVNPNIVEKWTSYDGLIKLFSGYGNRQLRNKPIMINGNFLCLTYDDGEKVGLFHAASELPEGYQKKYLRPTTYTELFYLECAPAIEKKLLQTTRYPVEGLGSIFVARPILKPFNNNTGKRVRQDGGLLDGHVYPYYPIANKDVSFFDGMSISNVKLGLAGGDFDGDMMSGNSVMADDSIEEAYRLFGLREYYISASGDFLYDPVIKTHDFLLRALTV